MQRFARFVKHPHTQLGRAAALKEALMLYWTAVFFVLAIVAGVLGFGGIAASAAGIAKILFFVFIVVAIISFVMGRLPKKG